MDEDQDMKRFGREYDLCKINYRKRKGKPVLSKKDVLYGVSASANSDDEGASSRKRKKVSKSKTDFTKPVHFISAETLIPSQETDLQAKGKKKQDNEGKDEEGGEDSFLGSEFGKKIKEGPEQRRERSKLSAYSDVAGSRRRSELFRGDLVGFEKYGIGMKILEKMGYKGGGLGKNEQGIVAPIEAKPRPKNMGMGFNDHQGRARVRLSCRFHNKNRRRKQPVARKKENLWKNSVKAHAKKQEEYITAEELLAKKQEQGVEPVQQMIIDMRGPQIQVLANLEELNAEENVKESDNIRLILDLAEFEIQELDRRLRNEQETAFLLQQEKEKLQKEAESQKQQLNNMGQMVKVLDHVNEEISSGILTLDSLAKSFGDLQRKFVDDYKICNLSSIACSYALPLFIRAFQGWDPLQNPSHGRNLILSWKNLLQREESLSFSGVASSYVQLIMEVVLPIVRISGINSWKARDPEPMLRFLEHWEDLLPSAVRQSIIDMIIIPKLSEAVDSWDPFLEKVPIHTWIQPWLPLMPEKLESLYEAIHIKLKCSLRSWHPSDSSDITKLNLCRTLFDPVSWEHLIVKSILPKLHEFMQDIQVNPADQKLDHFNLVMAWASAIPSHHMVDLLELHFFRKWHQGLYHWLTSKPNFDDVTKWYLGWKALFPPELVSNESIKIQLSKALEMMNQAVVGLPVVRPEENQFETQKSAAYAQKQPLMGIGTSHIDDKPEMSLTEIIAAYGMEHDVLFMPKPERFHDSHQIYRFGNVSIIVDSLNQKILANVGDKWSLVSLEQLLQMQSVSGSRQRQV